MNLEDYKAFTQALLESFQADPRVTGLVALGSMTGGDYTPDDWSDHDFFVITAPGEQDGFRASPGWLPDARDIVYHYQDTAHGAKALYRSGHLLEYAVFDLEELRQIRINRSRVLLDRGGVRRAVEEQTVETLRWSARQRERTGVLLGDFLVQLLVGSGRYARGEKLSGRQLVKGYGLQSLLQLIQACVPPTGPNRLDNLDPFRRFEQSYPALGEEINAILEMPTPTAARLFLTLAKRELAGCFPGGLPVEAIETVRQALLRAERQTAAPGMPWL